MNNGSPLAEVRAFVFTTLILSNILLTFVNRSFNETFLKTIRYKNDLALPAIVLSVIFLILMHSVPFIRDHFGMSVLSLKQFGICLLTALISVGWFEVYKTNLKSFPASGLADHKHGFQ